jgi:hypothetical protein
MTSTRFVPVRAGRRRLLRPLTVAAAVVSGALAPVALSGVAVADEPAGTTVVGTLVQAWAEAAPAEAEHGHDDHGPISWVQPADGGESVLIDTEGVEGIPVGSTVAVTVGTTEASSADGQPSPLPVVDSTVVAPPVAEAAPRPAPITNEVTVAMVAPLGSAPAGDGTTLAQVVSAVDRAAAFWSEQSDGAINLGTGPTHGWAPATVDCSRPDVLWDEVAARVNFVPGPGKHLLLYVSRTSDCAYAMAEVGSAPTSGGRLYVRDTTTSVVAHEFGHNFGLGHSSGQQCDAGVESGSCRTVAYRDYYDVMGVSWSQTGTLNAPQAALLGVLPQHQQQALTVRDGATTATLAPVSGRGGTRAVRLTDAEGVDYWLEYRTATGRDGWLASANRFGLDSGVLLRRAGDLPDTSVLLDGTPTAATGWDRDHRAALPVGVPVPVSGADFTVVVQSVSTEGAVVTVTPTPPAAGAAPASAIPRAPRGGVMSGSAGAVVEVPAAAAGEPVVLQTPELVRVSDSTTAAVESVAAPTSTSTLLAASAGAALLAATTLLVGRLRRLQIARR